MRNEWSSDKLTQHNQGKLCLRLSSDAFLPTFFLGVGMRLRWRGQLQLVHMYFNWSGVYDSLSVPQRGGNGIFSHHCLPSWRVSRDKHRLKVLDAAQSLSLEGVQYKRKLFDRSGREWFQGFIGQVRGDSHLRHHAIYFLHMSELILTFYCSE